VEQRCALCGQKTQTPILLNGVPYHPVCFVVRGIVPREEMVEQEPWIDDNTRVGVTRRAV
jgi:hypothetical protein